MRNRCLIRCVHVGRGSHVFLHSFQNTRVVERKRKKKKNQKAQRQKSVNYSVHLTHVPLARGPHAERMYDTKVVSLSKSCAVTTLVNLARRRG